MEDHRPLWMYLFQQTRAVTAHGDPGTLEDETGGLPCGQPDSGYEVRPHHLNKIEQKDKTRKLLSEG